MALSRMAAAHDEFRLHVIHMGAGVFHNTIGAVGAAFANWHTGTVVEQSVAAKAVELNVPVSLLDEAAKTSATLAGYQTVFTISAIVYVAAAICWLFIRVDRPLVAEE